MHRLHSIDPVNRTALCAHCGLAPIRRKSTSHGYYWLCLNGRYDTQKHSQVNGVAYSPEPKKHLISNVVDRIGVCSVCGPGARVKANRDRWRCYSGYAEKKNRAERERRVAARKAKTGALKATIILTRRALAVSAPSDITTQMRLLVSEFEDRVRVLERIP